MRSTKLSSKLFAGLASATLALGCVGEPPEQPEVEDPGEPEVNQLQVSGLVMDYFSLEPLENAQVDTEGLSPARTTTSGAGGAFALEVDVGSVFFATTALSNYRPTKNEELSTIAGVAVERDLYVASVPDVERQYATVQVIMEAGTSFLAIDLRDDAGLPLVGVPAESITLVDTAVDPPAPVGVGPFFFNEIGDIQLVADLPASVDTPRGARAAFLNVPAGNLALSVEAIVGGQPQTFRVPMIAIADGAQLVRTGVVDGNADLPQPGERITFRETIYPMLQRASRGGLACASCHTANGTYPALQFDLLPEAVYAQGDVRPGLFIASPDPVAAMESMILSKPLYEDPPNHPNATFASVEDPRYQLWLQWLVEGAVYE